MRGIRILRLLLFIPGVVAGALHGESNDRPNKPAAGLCKEVGIKVVNDGLHYEGGSVKVSGSWETPGGPARGVLLEYRLDSDRYQAETQSGTAGKWRYSEEEFKECGSHVFEIVAFPSVVEDGRTVYCLPLGKTVRAFFDLPCQGMTSRLDCTGWSCKEGRCTGTCTGDATGGEWGYVALFGVNDANYMNLPSSPKGPWTQTVSCAPGERVSFKVRDRLGAGGFSPITERPCGQ